MSLRNLFASAIEECIDANHETRLNLTLFLLGIYISLKVRFCADRAPCHSITSGCGSTVSGHRSALTVHTR